MKVLQNWQKILFLCLKYVSVLQLIFYFKGKNFFFQLYSTLKTEAELINWSELSLINEPNSALNNLVSKIKICLSKAEYSKKDYKKIYCIQEKTKEKLYKLWKKYPNNTKNRENYRKFN